MYYDRGDETDAEHRLWMIAHVPLVGHAADVCIPLVDRRTVSSQSTGHDSTMWLKKNKASRFFDESHYDYILNPPYDPLFAPNLPVY